MGQLLPFTDCLNARSSSFEETNLFLFLFFQISSLASNFSTHFPVFALYQLSQDILHNVTIGEEIEEYSVDFWMNFGNHLKCELRRATGVVNTFRSLTRQ